MNDGATAVLLMSAERARAEGLTPLGTWLTYGESAAEHPYLATVPALAIEAALRRSRMARSTPGSSRWWRSTRPSPRSRSRAPACSRWTPTASTSRAARSRRASDRRERCAHPHDAALRAAPPRRRLRCGRASAAASRRARRHSFVSTDIDRTALASEHRGVRSRRRQRRSPRRWLAARDRRRSASSRLRARPVSPGILTPVAYGGAGGNHRDFVEFVEAVARVDASSCGHPRRASLGRHRAAARFWQ